MQPISGVLKWGFLMPPRAHVATSEDIFVVQSATSILCIKARDAAEHPPRHRTAPTTENDLAPKVSSAEAETHCLKSSVRHKLTSPSQCTGSQQCPG